jgi:hypothetical protein
MWIVVFQLCNDSPPLHIHHLITKVSMTLYIHIGTAVRRLIKAFLTLHLLHRWQLNKS